MSKSLNKVFILGNVGKDPEVRSTANGVNIANFSIATTDRQKDKSGNWNDNTEWHSIVAFGKTAEIVRDHVSKGHQVLIEGRIQTRSWDKDGVKQYRTEIVVNELTLLGSKTAAVPVAEDTDEIPW